MKKAAILGILMILLLATTVSSVSTTQCEKTQTKVDDITLDGGISLIFGYVYHKGTDLPLPGAKVKFLIIGYKIDTTIFDGSYGYTGYLYKSRNCTGIAWAKGHQLSIVNTYINAGHSNQVDFYL